MFTVSLNPSYYCNFRCYFCYLTKNELSDKKTLSIEKIDLLFNEIMEHGIKIDTVDIYGGEPFLLGHEYIKEIRHVCNKHKCNTINIITNMSIYDENIINDEDLSLFISYDFDERQVNEHVWLNMLKIPRNYGILTLGLPNIFKKNHIELITKINLLKKCSSWEIKPYSTNQDNQLMVPNDDYGNFVRKIIEYENKNFEFINEYDLQNVINGRGNSYSDDHIYIAPDGKFKVLEFDDKNNEYFLSLDSFDDYLQWQQNEKYKVRSNVHCGSCEYLGKCLSEHLRVVDNTKDDCNGFYKLINWYKKNDD